MDLTKFSIIELKALAHDELVLLLQAKQAEMKVQAIHAELKKRVEQPKETENVQDA